MEQLIEQETSSIHPSIMGFALASTYAEIEFNLEESSGSSSALESITVEVPPKDYSVQEILLESYLIGWPWVIAQQPEHSFGSGTWALSSLLSGYINRVNIP